MQKSKIKPVYLFSTIAILVIAFAVFYKYYWIDKSKINEQGNKELEKIEKSLNQNKAKKDSVFDLEQTIRILHGLDKALLESKNDKEFILYMSKQDFSLVAPDVAAAKSKMIPIIRKLVNKLNELEDSQDLWPLFTNMSASVITSAMGITAKTILSPNPVQKAKISGEIVTELSSIAKSTFTELKQRQDLSNKIKNALLDIEDEYNTYLTEFYPIYNKYMKQWDDLCLQRDRIYLSINQGSIVPAFTLSNEILKKYPTDRETHILKALSLLLMQRRSQNLTQEIPQDYTTEAKNVLDSYLKLYPDKSAPALLLMGVYYSLTGDKEQALSHFDQSAVEYPRQSALLLDMLNSYNQREYLRKSAEGMFVVKQYKSTMEGFGFFSPNFQKAIMAVDENDFEKSKEEILRHFFRRGNQGVYDFLIEDLLFCEDYLSESLNLILREKSFIDLLTSTTILNSKVLNVKLNNRTDKRLSNVRIFLCLQFTDMYKEDYQVFKVNTTLNQIEPHKVVDFGDTEIDFRLYDKQKRLDRDIVSARAIVLTNESIAWIDKDDFKLEVIRNSYNQLRAKSGENRNQSKTLQMIKLDEEKLLETLNQETKIETVVNYVTTDEIKIKLPRVLTIINPYFSINPPDTRSAVLPTSVRLDGPVIDVQFSSKIPRNGVVEFYLSSEDVKICWRIKIDSQGKADGFSIAFL